jgi:uncharacterized protein (UPF0332 family)
MDPARFLDLALILKGGHATPESYRTAISRSYYAAFHVGVKALKVVGIRPSDGPGGHGEVVRCLGACGDTDMLKAANRLRTLHGRRLQADYDLNDPGVECRTEADIACIESSQIIDQIDKLISDINKAAARSEMRRVARDIFKLPVS